MNRADKRKSTKQIILLIACFLSYLACVRGVYSFVKMEDSYSLVLMNSFPSLWYILAPFCLYLFMRSRQNTANIACMVIAIAAACVGIVLSTWENTEPVNYIFTTFFFCIFIDELVKLYRGKKE